MPKLLSFRIQNFKGAEDVIISFTGKNCAPVTTLIGLNESGKTTILEGISYFVTGDNAISNLFDGAHSKSSIQDIIPIHKKAAFTGTIFIAAHMEWELEDLKQAHAIAKDHGLEIQIADEKNFTVTSEYAFKDSVPTGDTNRWTIEISSRTGKRGKFAPYERPDNANTDAWLQIVRALRAKMPRVVYFPTFLVDTPSNIYLREHEGETPVNRYYRLLMQDVLSSIDPNLSIQKHVVDRIEEFKKNQNNPTWISMFFGAPSKSHIDSVFQKIANALTREVIGSWSRVFSRPSGAKSILIDWNIDTQKSDLPYLTFSVSDGESRYSVSERSLGFRWFFSFLLFTTFKQASNRPTLFLFDEPAANLHAKAQAELLKNFGRIATNGNRIIYSTHSHHMIDPRWLNSAYIIENAAIDYDSTDTFELNSSPTKITAKPYRNFVAEYPTRVSYFQPVIEKLEYVSPEIIGNAPFVIIEGITDYYALRYTLTRTTVGPLGFSLMPGVGAGASGTLVSYLLGRGDKFLLLLDDDKAGRIAAERYRSEWFLPDSVAITLGELLPEFGGKQLEGLFSDDALEAIKSDLGLSRSPTKKEIGLYLAEICAQGPAVTRLIGTTLDNFKKVLAELRSRVSALP